MDKVDMNKMCDFIASYFIKGYEECDIEQIYVNQAMTRVKDKKFTGITTRKLEQEGIVFQAWGRYWLGEQGWIVVLKKRPNYQFLPHSYEAYCKLHLVKTAPHIVATLKQLKSKQPVEKHLIDLTGLFKCILTSSMGVLPGVKVLTNTGEELMNTEPEPSVDRIAIERPEDRAFNYAEYVKETAPKQEDNQIQVNIFEDRTKYADLAYKTCNEILTKWKTIQVVGKRTFMAADISASLWQLRTQTQSRVCPFVHLNGTNIVVELCDPIGGSETDEWPHFKRWAFDSNGECIEN